MVKEAIAGIGNVVKQLSRIGKAKSLLCQKCMMTAVETKRHLIEECPARIRHRLEILHNVIVKLEDIVWEGDLRQLAKYMIRVRRINPSLAPNHKWSIFLGCIANGP